MTNLDLSNTGTSLQTILTEFATIFPNTPIVAYKKEKSFKDFLLRAKIPSIG